MSHSLGLFHQTHPLLGLRVVDHAHNDRIGLFRAYAPEVPEPNPDYAPAIQPNAPLVAWIAPESGGLEWTTNPASLEAL